MTSLSSGAAHCADYLDTVQERPKGPRGTFHIRRGDIEVTCQCGSQSFEVTRNGRTLVDRCVGCKRERP